jgi:ubiquinone/menaquinone biosynthesis C-methylase UbiE
MKLANVHGQYQDGEYLAKNPGWHAEHSAWKAGEIAKAMQRNALSPGTVCEVGCGAGEVLKNLSERLPQTTLTGYEVSGDAFSLCKRHETERLKFVLADAITEGVRFDLALCIDVVEHVEDCYGFLRGLHRVSSTHVFHIPLDVYVLSVIRRTMMATRFYVGHLHYFTPETALATLHDCGFNVMDSFLTKSFDGAPSDSTEARLMRIPRRMAHKVAPNLTQTLIGGCSLMVVAKSRESTTA